ncbi:NADPH-dependent 2,4-dienoyl-CoA reductase [Ignavibacterium album JCM 16511]|uniref:NADPH-dependent 2,4-dienoyl-CoA reductase n=1 Tax=Ignavibacterium album (strain DSM 19864 / JCM 16511 / NBRC 101810 / Mat9-16) TaxID=945713 RepID=I0AIN4_IGNAJ|nr:NAD(P)/FAD-dependent oxidoreductase [Ignavibacterium album]AFH48841.1 NADPH-dependent 2,4-dienoyl-CoA reductase [Ignavibacterium album JCM 16511]
MKLENIELRNNFFMSAVKTGYGDADGNISERHFAFWDKRSKHVAAVIFEPFFIDKKVRELPTQIGIDSDDKITGHKKLVEAVHRNGAKAVAHINHPGRMANPKLPNNIYLSASEIECPNGGPKPKALSIEEIKIVQQQYVDAAIRAEKAGYDLIELQFGLGYLIAQFISPNSNKRNDEYGGSFENRLRFGLEILRGIKSTVKLPLIVRLSGDEKYEGGLTINESIKIAKVLEQEEIAALHITSGDACMSPPWYYQHHFIPKGKTWELAKKIKENVSLPIITVGQINEPEDIEEILSHNAADFIAIGRALIADPDFVGKYLKQVEGRIRPCSSCLTGCLGRIKIGKGLQCEINPLVGRELEEITPATEKKNYAVVGGGLAGMQSALALKQRGHQVTLFEKEKLGGQFNFAPLPSQKQSLQKQIDYFVDEIKDAQIEVINKEATAEDLIGKYDGVIIASGSKPFIPPIDGLKEYHWAEILYEFNLPKNKHVLIIGGGLIGVEIANTLVDHGNKVVIIEMLEDIARDMEMVTRKLNLMKLKKASVQIFTNSKVTRIDANKIYFIQTNGTDKEQKIDGVDVFVVATGMKPNKDLIDKLEGKIPYYVIGDADKIGDAVSAIQSGYFIAKEL